MPKIVSREEIEARIPEGIKLDWSTFTKIENQSRFVFPSGRDFWLSVRQIAKKKRKIIDLAPGERRCTDCGIHKKIEDFCFNSRYRGTVCPTCKTIRAVEWQKNNPQKRSLICKRWSQKNPKYACHQMGIHRAKRKLRFPRWITKTERIQIRRFYENCPDGYHVDHIIPLMGKTVSGFHMLSNLQYLPAIENIKKGNRF